jgi:hypothetical protein
MIYLEISRGNEISTYIRVFANLRNGPASLSFGESAGPPHRIRRAMTMAHQRAEGNPTVNATVKQNAYAKSHSSFGRLLKHVIVKSSWRDSCHG